MRAKTGTSIRERAHTCKESVRNKPRTIRCNEISLSSTMTRVLRPKNAAPWGASTVSRLSVSLTHIGPGWTTASPLRGEPPPSLARMFLSLTSVPAGPRHLRCAGTVELSGHAGWSFRFAPFHWSWSVVTHTSVQAGHPYLLCGRGVQPSRHAGCNLYLAPLHWGLDSSTNHDGHGVLEQVQAARIRTDGRAPTPEEYNDLAEVRQSAR